jgi:hypothetical protein
MGQYPVEVGRGAKGRTGDIHSKWPTHKNPSRILKTRVYLNRAVDVDFDRGGCVLHETEVNSMFRIQP